MYLSTLLIDTGTNPDRPRPGRLWLRNLYRVHQRLCMAFPSREQKDQDAQMLEPFAPGQYAQGHVHVRRSGSSGFLFRVDPRFGGSAVIVVLSALEPDWGYAFHNAGYLLAGAPQIRPMQVTASPGEHFRFRLLANTTTRSPMSRQQRLAEKATGQKIKRPRHQLTWQPGEDPAAVCKRWLEQRSSRLGFQLHRLEVAHLGYVYIHKGGQDQKGQRLRSVRYEGVLEVTDADIFGETLACGIGPAKAFGFGLLSIAPLGG
jgi:CRISPR system Cascade subunit CasE